MKGKCSNIKHNTTYSNVNTRQQQEGTNKQRYTANVKVYI